MLVGVAGCTPTVVPSMSPSPAARTTPEVTVDNGTTIAITVVVNGAVVETVPAGIRQRDLGFVMPSLPWRIEARSPSGRVLTSLTITSTDVIDASHGKFAYRDLSCGRVSLSSGGDPVEGPVAGTPSPGDCD